MIVKLLTEHLLEFLSLKGGCRGSYESTHAKMPHCWKSHALALNCICFVFSGIPGVLNNAYKMSSMFPKAPPPTSAPPHHILHACNRLVTPVPVTTPPSPTKDDNYGMVRYIYFLYNIKKIYMQVVMLHLVNSYKNVAHSLRNSH